MSKPQPIDVDRLAQILMEATIAVYEQTNGNGDHTSKDLALYKEIARVGYRKIAMELVRKGVKL